MAQNERTNPLIGFAVLTSVAAFLLAAVGVIVSATDDGGGGGGSGSETAAPVAVELTEWAITPDSLQVPTGAVQLAVTNGGTQVHNLQLDGGPVTADLDAGGKATLDLDLAEAGSYTIFCAIPGHRDQGMEATLIVSDEPVEGGEPPMGEEGESEPDYAEMDTSMHESIMNFSALNPDYATGAAGNEVLEPVEVEADGTKVFELTAAITDWTTEKGRTVKAWTYNGMVPAPWLKLDVGDHIKVRVINDLPMGTDIHWHGLDTPNDQDGVSPLTQPMIESGDTYTYEFTVDTPAVAMYHPHHHGELQLPNGMFGAITVGDLGSELPLPEGRTISGVALPATIPVSQEIPMVLNDSGVIGLSLNGKSFPSTDAFVGEVGDWVAVHYYNEGNLIHPMHQHQFNQLVIAKDGIPLDQPYWVDTLNVAPGERYTVLLHLTEPGVWLWHCHILTHAERETGVFGMVTAWIVGTPGEDFEIGGTGSAT